MALSTEPESIEAIQAEIVENLSTLDEWVDRYAYLVDLGKKLIRQGEHLKSEQYKIPGCQSNVWLRTESSGHRLYFSGTSDSTIVAGLMALLFKVYSGRPADEIRRTPADFITQTGLVYNLTSQRSTGLAKMVEQIHRSANQFCEQQGY